MSFVNKIRKRAFDIGFKESELFASFAAAFIIASVFFALGGDFQDMSYIRQYPLWIPVIISAVGTVLLVALSLLWSTRRLVAWILALSSVVLSVILVRSLPDNIFFCIGIFAVLVLVAKYVTDDDRLGLSRVKLTDRSSIIIVSVLVLLFSVAVYVMTAAKYKAFYHSGFDFGIFCQMFENMVKTGLPYTTIERNEYLSHFAVHFSPFFYLLLPGYLIWRSPLYLLFAQGLGIALGAFPVRRICRSLGLTPSMATAGAAVYLLFPTMANGCFYDFHENKFLSVLILWAVAFALEKNKIGTVISCFLILTVKEDAFIYVIAICLWMFVTKRNRILSLIIAVFSVGWFFFACNMIQLSGGEIMTGRFSNYSAGGGLFDAVRTCFIDIGYLLKEVFAGADTEAFRELTYPGQKLEFILWTCIPLLFTPFLRKKPSELVLLLPLLVINLMPSWLYQYNVDFQYTYGTAALLIFSSLLFLGEHKRERQRFVLFSAFCLCIVFSVSLISPKVSSYTSRYYENRERYDETEKALEMIPEDASVTAYGYIVPHLWYIDDLRTCPGYYGKLVQTDYYVVDTRYEYDSHTEGMYKTMKNDYDLVLEKGYVKIYERKNQKN